MAEPFAARCGIKTLPVGQKHMSSRRDRLKRSLSRSGDSLRSLFGRSKSLRNLRDPGVVAKKRQKRSDSSLSSSRGVSTSSEDDAPVFAYEDLDERTAAAKRQCTKNNDWDSCDIYARDYCAKHRVSLKTEAELLHFLSYAKRHRYLPNNATLQDVETMCTAFMEGPGK